MKDPSPLFLAKKCARLLMQRRTALELDVLLWGNMETEECVSYVKTTPLYGYFLTLGCKCALSVWVICGLFCRESVPCVSLEDKI